MLPFIIHTCAQGSLLGAAGGAETLQTAGQPVRAPPRTHALVGRRTVTCDEAPSVLIAGTQDDSVSELHAVSGQWPRALRPPAW